MILHEQLSAAQRQLDVKILATDVHPASLAHASAGFYGEEQLEHVSEQRRERFFRKKSSGYAISQDLRQLIVFAPHNVTKDAPFTKMHLISCRNMLIYLEPQAQKTVLSLFHFGLATGGYLFLGSSESPGAIAHEFDVVDEHSKIYRKRRDVRLLEPLKMPVARKAAVGGRPSFLGHVRPVTAETFSNPRTSATHVLISIENETTGERRESTPAPMGNMSAEQVSLERLDTLEGELSYTRETLQSTIEELQTSNEEMQATNEELVASNEELQSTNEELHSVNEELYTVNAELQRKIAELRELNSDMQHFLESTDAGTLFLDRNLCIRKYTPRIASVFHIEPQDVSRSIRHFSNNLKRSTLQQDIERALHDGTVLEDEVKDAEGTTYFLRILPYRTGTSDGGDPMLGTFSVSRIEGVVLSLTDISALDRVRSRVRHLSAIVESSEDAIIGKTLDGIVTTWNRAAERLYGYSPDEVIGRNITMLSPTADPDDIRLRKDGTVLDVSVTISPVCDADGTIVGASAIARDVTQLRIVQRELTEREGRIRLLLDSTAEGIFGLGPDGTCTFGNPACVRMLGYASAEDLIGRHIHPLIHPTHQAEDCPIYSVLYTGKGTHSDEEQVWRAGHTNHLFPHYRFPHSRGGQDCRGGLERLPATPP